MVNMCRTRHFEFSLSLPSRIFVKAAFKFLPATDCHQKMIKPEEDVQGKPACEPHDRRSNECPLAWPRINLTQSQYLESITPGELCFSNLSAAL